MRPSGRSRAGGRRSRVLWLINGLGPGGAERLLVAAAGAVNGDDFEYEAAYLLPWKSHLAAALEEAGVPVHCLNVSSPTDVRWLGRFRRLLREGDFDVVHSHSPLVGCLARLAVRLVPNRARPALVYTEHNTRRSQHPALRALSAVTYPLDDVHIAVSEETRRSVSVAWRRSVHVVAHGVAAGTIRSRRSERDEVRTELGVRPGEVLIGTVANYRPGKDYPTLLRAARLVVDAGVDARFIAVGQGPQEHDVEAEHARSGLGDRFVLLGYRPDPVHLLAGCDAFVLASTYEGLPVAIMEALALGLPIVASAVGGTVEAVGHGSEGLLVPPSDPEQLAEALLTLVRDPGLRRRLAENALKRSYRYDIKATVACIEDLYRGVVGSKRSSLERPRL